MQSGDKDILSATLNLHAFVYGAPKPVVPVTDGATTDSSGTTAAPAPGATAAGAGTTGAEG